MARIRTIKPEFPQSESMGRVSRESRLCFIMLWTIADDSGRLRGNSRMLASLLYPYDDDAKRLIDKWLAELAAEGCIKQYDVDGDKYIEIAGWQKHQKIDKPSISKIPSPPEDSRGLARIREASAADQGEEGKGREGNSDTSADAAASPPFILIPLNDNTEFPVSLALMSEFKDTFPAVNVEQELREMRTWSLTNSRNRKTKGGVMAFMNRWLAKEQDKGPRQASNGQSSLMEGAV